MNNDSILKDVRKAAGNLIDTDDFFDTELLVFINQTLGNVYELGGLTEPYMVTSENDIWTDLPLSNDKILSFVITYVITSARILFDPPATAATLGAFQDARAESEWRIHSRSELETYVEGDEDDY